MSPLTDLPDSILELLPLLRSETSVWLVGGGVRDHLLGREIVDLDFVVEGQAIPLARKIADKLNAHFYHLDRERGAGRVILEQADGSRRTLDFTRLRGPDIEADLRARDFTVNAMAISLSESPRWLDPTGGIKDLKEKMLRTCYSQAIEDDPVRALRAIRLAVELDLRIAPDALNQVRHAGPGLRQVSPERIRDEMLHILETQKPGNAVRLLDQLDLLAVIFPELEPLRGLQQPMPHAYDAWEHMLAAVDRLSDLLAVLAPVHVSEAEPDVILAQATRRLGRFRDGLTAHLNRNLIPEHKARQLLFFAAFYLGAGKPAACYLGSNGQVQFKEYAKISADLIATRAEKLHFSKAEVQFLRTAVHQHADLESLQRSLPLPPRAIYRFFRQAGEAGVEAVLLSLAHFLSTHPPSPPLQAWALRVDVARALLEAYFEARDRVIDPTPLINGQDLLEVLGLEPGPKVGRLLEAIREAQAAGEVQTHAQALSLAREILAESQ
jgi:poly(A) polymerase